MKWILPAWPTHDILGRDVEQKCGSFYEICWFQFEYYNVNLLAIYCWNMKREKPTSMYVKQRQSCQFFCLSFLSRYIVVTTNECKNYYCLKWTPRARKLFVKGKIYNNAREWVLVNFKNSSPNTMCIFWLWIQILSVFVGLVYSDPKRFNVSVLLVN